MMEFKSHNYLDVSAKQKNEYTRDAFVNDVSKMKDMCDKNSDMTPDIYYIHLQMCRSQTKGEYIYPDAVSYNTADAITIGDKNGVEEAVTNFIKGFRNSISGSEILNKQDLEDVDKVFKYVGKSFECEIYMAPIIIYWDKISTIVINDTKV